MSVCAKQGLSTHSLTLLRYIQGDNTIYLCIYGAIEFYKDLLWDAEELKCSSVAAT